MVLPNVHLVTTAFRSNVQLETLSHAGGEQLLVDLEHPLGRELVAAQSTGNVLLLAIRSASSSGKPSA